MHDNWLRMLQDDEPPKSWWRPRKSTKSWDQLSVQKIHKSHTGHKKKVHRMGKNWSYRALWTLRACTKIRDAPAEKRRESKVQRSSTRTEMLFLWCFSAPSWERISAASRAHCTIKAILCFQTYGIDHSCEARVKCKIGYDGGLITWISAKPTDWTPEVNYHISSKMAKNSIMRRTSCSSLSRVLSTRSSCSTSPTSPTSFSQDWENFVMCPATIRSENMTEQAQRDLLPTQSQDDEQARKDPLPSELPWGKM